MTLESSGRTAEAPLARVVAVRKTYGEVIALDDVSLELPRGGLIGLLGPNGAGKSTLIGLLCGQRKPTAGQVEIFGGDPRMAANRVRLGMTPQETGLPPTLKVREVVAFVAAHYPDPLAAGPLLERFGLSDKATSQTGALSGGQKRRLALALALVGRPDLILLDEPTTGLDVEARRDVWEAIRDYHTGGGTVVLSSHNMTEVEALARRVVVIDHGRIVADDDVSAIRTRVATRRVSLRAAMLPHLPGTERVTTDGDHHELFTSDSDAVVRQLVASGAPFSDLEVASASLEEAFVAITRQEQAA
jgi:ABC-2 type transport system ATP-binding protein